MNRPALCRKEVVAVLSRGIISAMNGNELNEGKHETQNQRTKLENGTKCEIF